MYPQEINVYETYHAGGTKKVQGKTDSGTWFTLYETDKIELIKESRIFKVPLKVSSFYVNVYVSNVFNCDNFTN